MNIDTEKLYEDVEKIGDEALLEAVSELITSYQKARSAVGRKICPIRPETEVKSSWTSHPYCVKGSCELWDADMKHCFFFYLKSIYRLQSVISEGFSLAVMRGTQISNALAQIAADLAVVAGSKTLNERLAEMGKAPVGVGTKIEEAIKKNELSEDQNP